MANSKTTLAFPLFTASQARQIDHRAIHQLGHSGLELMKRAGRGAFRCIQQRIQTDGKIIVLCGPGNNGGDGYVVAKLLHQSGASVAVVRSALPATRSAKIVCDEFLSVGGVIEAAGDTAIQSAELIIDGLLGAGINRPPAGEIGGLINQCEKRPCPVVALDMPSGLEGDTGFAHAPSITAQLTITFIVAKVGLYTGDGPALCGEIVIDDLDLDQSVRSGFDAVAGILSTPALPPRAVNSHKGLFGSVLIAGGDEGMCGAVLLAGKAALRAGAGLVSVASREQHSRMISLAQPELMTFVVDREQLPVSVTASCYVLGPGTMVNDWGRAVFAGFSDFDIPRVVDAGGLRVLAEDGGFNTQQVLTPHPGEAAALLGISSKQVQQNRIYTAREIAIRYGGVCVLKGVGTIIASQTETMICDLGNPGMASAGMGDVLSGVIGALLAGGMGCFEAACVGVWLHAGAGDLAAREKSEYALIASDVIDALPQVLNRVTEKRSP